MGAGSLSTRPQVLAPPGNSREASILALLFVAGPAVLTGATGTAVQGHLTVSALGRKSAMGTPGASASQQPATPRQRSLPVPGVTGALVPPSSPPPPGPASTHLIAARAGAPVPLKGVILAAALVPARAGQAGITLGLDSQSGGT